MPESDARSVYVTVVRCSQTGWIETMGLKKSLGSHDGRGVGLACRNPPASTSLQALLLLLVLLLLVVVVEVTVV